MELDSQKVSSRSALWLGQCTSQGRLFLAAQSSDTRPEPLSEGVS